MKSNKSCLLPLRVVFVSLGGTKFQISAIWNDLQVLSGAQIRWRGVPKFSSCLEKETAGAFCDALASSVGDFLQEHEGTWADVSLIGLGLPGPRIGGRWYSFNLTKAFVGGVDLASDFSRAVSVLNGGSSPPVRVAFDAQCDAGGELYHPFGRLKDLHRQGGVRGGTVINIATGIAAGFVMQGKVLVTDEDFSKIDTRYDCGAGQIGRHLWLHAETGEWQYHYAPHGWVPNVPGATRMTELLSGPALAAKLLRLLGENDCLPTRGNWMDAQVTVEDIQGMWHELHAEADIRKRSQRMRQAAKPVSTAVLAWADRLYANGQANRRVSGFLDAFARDVAGELADAIRALAAAPSWRPLLNSVVLTGGVGINFLASVDLDSRKSFCMILNDALPEGITAERSRLRNSAERGAYLFLCQSM
jgi:hypothetical protein